MKPNRRILSLLLAFALTVSLTFVGGCAEKKNNFTLLIYMCGSDLETKNGAATKNITEMLTADIPEGTKVVIQTGGAKTWRKYDIPSDCLNRYVIENKELKLVESNPIASMGNAGTLASFLNFGLENYPAENTAVILWDHGGGSAKGVCKDELFDGDLLSLGELVSAMKSANLTKKLSFVGFDACLMANYETACLMEPYAEKMMASEELEPSSGWDYASLLTHLDDLKQAVDGYAEKHADKNYYTMSLVDLTKFDIVNNLSSQILKNLSEGEKNQIARAVYHSIQFGSSGAYDGGSDLYDLGGVAEYLGIEYDLSECIYTRNGDARSDACGLSFYFPLGDQSYLAGYLANVSNLNYADYIANYFSDGVVSEIEFVNRGEAKDGKLFFSLTSESDKSVCSVQYTLYRADLSALLNGEYKFWGIGHDTDIIENGNEYTVDFVGNWVTFNGCILNCQVISELENYTMYSSVIKVNGELCNLEFIYDKTTHKLQISGYASRNDSSDRMTGLKDGDEITIMYDEFSDYTSSRSFTEGETFIYSSEEMPLTVKKLENDAYLYRAIISDIYGDRYYTNYALIVMTDGELEMIDILSYDTDYDDIVLKVIDLLT
jgi:hypothetical protein